MLTIRRWTGKPQSTTGRKECASPSLGHPMRFCPTIASAVAALAMLPAVAGAAPVPAGAEWTQATIPSSDGVQLHADILRPKGLAPDTKTPVILSIGPYFNHSGQVGPAGPTGS